MVGPKNGTVRCRSPLPWPQWGKRVRIGSKGRHWWQWYGVLVGFVMQRALFLDFEAILGGVMSEGKNNLILALLKGHGNLPLSQMDPKPISLDFPTPK